MNAVLKDTPVAIVQPALSILQLEMQANTTDRALRTNLEHVKGLGLPTLEIHESHERVLAIVGSGPSLRETHGLIPSDCDVMALNGAYSFLRSKGRTAKYFAMLDSRDVNVNFLEDMGNSTEYLIASQCHQSIFERVPEATVFHLCTPTAKAVFPDEPLYVGGGGTIGLTALGLAIALGYRKVILYGYDSSFAGQERHAKDQPQNADLQAIDVWVQDRKYTTTHAMAAQTMDFFPFYEAIKKVAPEFEIHLIGSGLFYDYIVTNNNPSTRERELAKYVEAYKHDDYGMTQERRDALDEIVSGLTGDSFLDVSTGRGELLEVARSRGFKTVKGTETVPDLCGEHVTQAVLPSIPFPDASFDVVSLIEVIEHLLPDDIRPALVELTRLSRKHVLISAATYAHWYGGVNLHPSARPEEEWQALFAEVWGDRVKRVRNLGQSPCWLVTL
jgi:hypothetical protein